MDELRETVRERYAAAATSVKSGLAADDVTEAACCAPANGYGLKFYDITERGTIPDEAVLASRCAATLRRSPISRGRDRAGSRLGGGIDVLLSAQRVGPTGFVYGLDMTDEMLELARDNARKAEATNVEFLKGPSRMCHCPTRASTS